MSLTLTHRVWEHFVCAKIHPSGHLSTVDTKKALMMYVISQRIRINTGEIIYSRILHASRSSKSYLYPNLITALCVSSGDPIGDTEVRRPPLP
ncbi:hypothetical protein, partial [Mangrovimonas futianensis]|uniref:hypothetical protein n=1 Tax=Mangrovimonas futianensis TaxID=2895523 RepID=UPI0034DE1B40